MLRIHTDAVIAALESAGLTVGDAEKPAGDPEKYAVVYPIPGGRRTGTLASPYADNDLHFQVTCVGESREQAQWVADQTEALLSGISVDGYSVHPVADVNPGIERDDTLTPPLFYCTPRYRFMTTPS